MPSNLNTKTKPDSTSVEERATPKIVALEGVRRNKDSNPTNQQYVPTTEQEFALEFLNDINKQEYASQNRAGLVVAAILSLFLPFSYLAFVGACAAGLVWHTNNNAHLLTQDLSQLYSIFYYAPFVITPLIVIFLLKPLFAKRVSRTGIKTLSNKEYGALARYINQLAKKMGTPAPKEIRVCIEPEVKYSLVSSQSAIVGKQFALTIGLPLLGALNNRQLSALIAHEMAYYAGTKDTRLIWLVRSLRAWFWRSAYQYDVWDSKLRQIQMTKSNRALQVITRELQTIIRVTKAINRWFFQLSEIASQAPLGALQKRADYLALQFAGKEDFKKAESIRHVLYMAYEKHLLEYDFSWENTHQDLPEFLISQLKAFKQNKAEYAKLKLNGRLASSSSSWQQRLKALDNVATTHQARHSYSAHCLLKQYYAFSRQCSDLFYHECFAIPLSNKTQTEQENNIEQLDKYFGQLYLANRLIGPTLSTENLDKKQESEIVNAQSLNQSILVLRSRLPDWKSANEQWNEAFIEFQRSVEAEVSDNPQPNLGALYGTIEHQSDELNPIEDALTQRLDLGLQLTLDRLTGSEKADLINDIKLAKFLNQQKDNLLRLSHDALVLASMLDKITHSREKYVRQTLQSNVKKVATKSARSLTSFYQQLEALSPAAEQPLVQQILRNKPEKRTLSKAVLFEIKAVLQSAYHSNYQLNSKLSNSCLETEASLKLSPLKVKRIQNR